MKPFIIALTLYLFVNISSCSTNDAPIVEPPNGETADLKKRTEDIPYSLDVYFHENA